MATQKTDNDAKRFGGYLKEKWTIGVSRVSSDELARAVIKVTSHKLKVPNEKHLARLVSATHGNINTGSTHYDDVNEYITKELEGHTHSRDWIVVIKTLIVYHELMNQGSDGVLQKIAARRQAFNTSHMKDLADSPDGAVQEGFIHAYTRYLEERCVTIASCRLQTRVESDEFLQHYLEVSPSSAEPITAALLLQLEVMLNVDLREAALNNHATLHAFKLVIQDGRRVYAVLTRRMAQMLEGFTQYPPAEKKRWLALFKRFQVATRNLADLFARMNRTSAVDFGEQLPTLRTMPDSIVVQLENYTLDDEEVKVTRLDRSAMSGDGTDGASPDAAAAGRKSPDLFKKKPTTSATATAAPTTTATAAGGPSPFAIAPSAAPEQPQPQYASAATAPSSTTSSTVLAATPTTAKKADPLDDLFGGDSAAPQRGAGAHQQQQQRGGGGGGMDDLFAPSAQAPVYQASASAPPPRTAAAPADDFDPFAPSPTTQWQSAAAPAPRAAATPPPAAAGSMDFFSTGAQPAAASNNNAAPRGTSGARPSGGGNHGDDQLEFFAASSSKPAGGDKPRAW